MATLRNYHAVISQDQTSEGFKNSRSLGSYLRINQTASEVNRNYFF